MNTISYSASFSTMNILNANRITEGKEKDAIRAMGLAACQARCLSCGHCAHHCGK